MFNYYLGYLAEARHHQHIHPVPDSAFGFAQAAGA